MRQRRRTVSFFSNHATRTQLPLHSTYVRATRAHRDADVATFIDDGRRATLRALFCVLFRSLAFIHPHASSRRLRHLHSFVVACLTLHHFFAFVRHSCLNFFGQCHLSIICLLPFLLCPSLLAAMSWSLFPHTSYQCIAFGPLPSPLARVSHLTSNRCCYLYSFSLCCASSR